MRAFPKPIVEALRADGHDVLWARTDCAGWKDSVLLDRAESEGRIVMTLDKDCWQIAVVLLRVHPAISENLGPLVGVFVDANREWPGHISMITDVGIEMFATRRN